MPVGLAPNAQDGFSIRNPTHYHSQYGEAMQNLSLCVASEALVPQLADMP